MAKTRLIEKVGYGFGDMSSSMFWKIFSYYLPIFYSDIFGLSLGATATLMLVTRIWDAVSDPMMGIIADRTETRWGKYRPYLLFFAAPFAIAGVLLFTTPDMSETGKLIWAYITYILMMTVYTGINVPYGSMLGVVTNDSDEKTVYSSFRMFFAYAGSFIALYAWEPLCHFFQTQGDSVASAWQHTMMVIATFCLLLFLACFKLTKEHVKVEATPLGSDLSSLIKNAPWWLITAAALCSNLFNTIRGATAAYYFKYYIGDGAMVDFGIFSFLFFAGIFLSIGEICNMAGVVAAVPISRKLGKRLTFGIACTCMAVLSVLFFFVPTTNLGFISMLILQVLISLCTGIISPLIWSMYADVADYAVVKDGSSSTGLIFSSGSMAQKFGGAIAGSAVLWLFAAFGMVPNAPEQTANAILGMKLTMSLIPAGIALLMVIIMIVYPLTKSKMEHICNQLKSIRQTNG